MSNANVTIKKMNLGLKARGNASSLQRVFRLGKTLLLLSLVPFLIMGSLYITGKIITSRIETETDPHALAPWGPGTSFITTSSGETHILDVGEGEVVLLIHGSTGSIADWQESVAYELAKSYRVVAFDSYGFGLSERNDSFEYGHPLWTQQAIEVLDALGIERAVVLGHSAGAGVAVALAAFFPERVSGAILSGHGFTFDPGQMLPVLPGIGENWAARQTFIGDQFSDSYNEQAEAVHRIRGTRAAYLTFVRNQVGFLFTEQGRELVGTIYEAIEVPVLQMHGTMDQSQDIDSARALSSRIADTRFVAIEGSDHHIHNEAPDQWVEVVSSFVESLSP
jgi:pimeloyl-ACP methyl ester carboxylesterase